MENNKANEADISENKFEILKNIEDKLNTIKPVYAEKIRNLYLKLQKALAEKKPDEGLISGLKGSINDYLQ